MNATTDRPNLLDILDQDEQWWPAAGGPIRLNDMGPRHRRNTLAMLRRDAPLQWLLIASAAAERASDGVMDDVFRADPDTWIEDARLWIEDTRLVTRLRELVAADQAAGVPDEPDERIGKPLPCASWCLTCKGQTFEPGAPLPCSYCPDCTPALAAADDATWD